MYHDEKFHLTLAMMPHYIAKFENCCQSFTPTIKINQHHVQKKVVHLILVIASSNEERFSKFIH